MKINKPILAWNQEDIEMLRDDPYNLEDLNIEYKEQYSGDANELRRDIVYITSMSIHLLVSFLKKS